MIEENVKLKKYNPDKWYFSESANDYIEIKSMSYTHLGNAIRKLDSYVIYSYKKGENKTIENMIVTGRGSDHPVYKYLLSEYVNRDPREDRNYDYVLEDKR